MSKKLAVNGGSKAVENFKSELCVWPIVTDEDREAIVEVLVIKVTIKFKRVWKGIMGSTPRKVPMAVPLARYRGSP